MPVLDRFYSAFAARDWATMGACYADDAHFSDTVFQDLDANGVRAMWRMLLTSGTDLQVSHRVEAESQKTGLCQWEAHYTFSRTGRKVHNIIRSEFELRNGLIVRQRDHFDFWRWSRQALGTTGLVLGWSPLMRNKVRATAEAALKKSMS